MSRNNNIGGVCLFGPGREDNSELVLSPEDDDIDVLNDETFGGELEGDAEWEESDKYEDYMYGEFEYENEYFNDRSSPSKAGLSNYYSEWPALGADDEIPDDELEKTVEKLIVDDDELSQRASEFSTPKRKHSGLNDPLVSMSPQGLFSLDELLTGQHVWGSPSTMSLEDRMKQEAELKALLHVMNTQSGRRDDPNLIEYAAPIAHGVRTLDDIEKELMHCRNGTGDHRPPGSEKSRGQPLTVEELEKQMMGDTVDNRKLHDRQQPAVIRPLMMMPRPGLLHLRPDMRFGGNVDHLRGHPGIGFLPGHPPPQPFMRPPVGMGSSSPIPIGRNGPMRHPPPPVPPGLDVNNLSRINAFNRTRALQMLQAAYAAGNSPMRAPPLTHLQQQQLLHRTGLPQRMPFMMPPFDPRNPLARHMFAPPNPRFPMPLMPPIDVNQLRSVFPGGHPALRGMASNGVHDEYAGLMTQREKDWIIKLQLMQLTTDNPYVDDYYYTLWLLKKMAAEAKKKEDGVRESDDKFCEPKLLLPQIARIETKTYQPMQFEGALGKLTTSSVHNPRQILDVRAADILDSDEPKNKEIRRYKSLMKDIEKGYDFLLEVDEIEKKALAMPEASRELLIEQRQKLIGQLSTILLGRTSSSDLLVPLLSVKKGLRLLSRSLVLLNQTDGKTIIGSIYYNVNAITVKKEWHDEVKSQFCQAVSHVMNVMTLHEVVILSAKLKSGTLLRDSLSSVLASSLVWYLLRQAGTLFKTLTPLDLAAEDVTEWKIFVLQFADVLQKTDKSLFVKPFGQFASVTEHLQNILPNELFLNINEGLKLLVNNPAKLK